MNMQIIDLTNSLAKKNILTGRSALAFRNFGCSSDPRVIMHVYNGKEDIYSEPRWFIPAENGFETEVLNGVKIATLNQSLYHALQYNYDDSLVEEINDLLTDEELEDFLNWMNIKRSDNALANEKIKDILLR